METSLSYTASPGLTSWRHLTWLDLCKQDSSGKPHRHQQCLQFPIPVWFLELWLRDTAGRVKMCISLSSRRPKPSFSLVSHPPSKRGYMGSLACFEKDTLGFLLAGSLVSAEGPACYTCAGGWDWGGPRLYLLPETALAPAVRATSSV